MGFRCSPIEYLTCWEQDPRLMAILEAVQSRWREKAAAKVQKPKKG